MNIDRMEFLAWMERLLERLDLLGEHVNDLQKKRNSIDGEELLDNQDLLQMLKISNRSLQRYRSIGVNTRQSDPHSPKQCDPLRNTFQ